MLDGPRLAPRSGRPPNALVVLLHGYGADGRDLIDLGKVWAPLLPEAAFVSPHAPEPCAVAPVGRQWFGYVERDDRERWIGVQAAEAALSGFLDAELARLGLSDDRMALVGFSQGTMMALHVGLRRPRRCAGILGYSGIHVRPSEREQEVTAARIASRPPVLLIHGDEDEVVAPGYLPRAVASLAAQGITAESFLLPGLGHGIDQAGLERGGAFLAKILA
ncbi:phospholipase [Starkeya sp. ORNL1]|uniref:alpha/beta hydrolase n=1 Tax=Starkeya sp. ORNL1 TaxID=2709380 RepID=UPI001462F46D|nr:dienelactone hydrolase family protein [Starkeya sp. ORNL1]QJP16187.1 phospholipase [Starkeya sp. ORNL1]